jgi:hypothetical protein
MKKNIAITPISQNIKNINKFRERKSPVLASWKSTIRNCVALCLVLCTFPASEVANNTMLDIMNNVKDIGLMPISKFMFRLLIKGIDALIAMP